MTDDGSIRRQRIRWFMGIAMVLVGVSHFLGPEPFVRIVPAWLPRPLLLVYVSGFFEIAGGVGIVIPATRRAAAVGLILLYVAVFPANINMAIHHIDPVPGQHLPTLLAWARLPFQALFIAAAYVLGDLGKKRDAAPRPSD